ncbi:recombinase family protein [Vagococcus salmoninarum]|nr:recombinase family protein [Vagococcus salmoninarum]
MKTYGYVRKSYLASADEQMKKLDKYTCTKIFVENEKAAGELELRQLLNEISSDDCLVILSMKIFGKSASELIALMVELKEKSIRLISIQDELDSTKPLSFYQITEIVANSLEEK